MSVSSLSTVLIAARRPVLRAGLVSLVGDASCPRQADSLDAAHDALRRHPTDVVLLALPDPAEALRRLTDSFPDIPCLVVTSRALRTVGMEALTLGAAGVLRRRRAPEELPAALQTVASGGRYISPRLLRILADSLSDGQNPVSLSGRERQIVSSVARGMTRTEIAASLALSTETVATYRRRALEKLGLRTDADLTRWALREAWITSEDPLPFSEPR